MSDADKLKILIGRCKKSVSYFIQTFCKIKHPSIGLLDFQLFSYQKRCLEDFRNHQFNIFKKCRQTGVSTLTGAYCLWFAMFHSNKTILIVSKRDLEAKEFLNRNVKFVYNNLPDWMKQIWQTPIDNEHQFGFTNGSTIRSLTSSPDTLRSYASSLNIIDEAAFMPHMEAMWAAGRSTLMHGGALIVISCVPKGTYVVTDQGPTLVDNFINDKQSGTYAVPKYNVLGRNKLREGGFFYNSGVADTKKLTTRYGEIEGSLAHQMYAYKQNKGFGWYALSELEIGDWLSTQYGMNCWGDNTSITGFDPSTNVKYPFNPAKITPDLAYLFGLYIAEGSVYSSKNCNSHKITITCGDDISRVLDRLKLPWTNTDGIHWQIFSTNLWELMLHLGFEHTNAPNKRIPNRLMQCSKQIIASLLSGMYDGDGHSRKRDGLVGYTTTSADLAKQIRIILNNFGVITTQRIRTAESANEYIKNNKKTKVSQHNHDTYIIECSKYYSSIFFDEIKFGFDRKQKNRSLCEGTRSGTSYDIIPNGHKICKEIFDDLPFGTWTLKHKYGLNLNVVLSNKARHKKNVSRKVLLKLLNVASQNNIDVSKYGDYINDKIIWSKIESVDYSNKEVYDFSLPDNNEDKWAHSVSYNGFIGHQTPNGLGNWYWSTWTDAKKDLNNFNAIEINWWDMDWALEWKDDVSGEQKRLAPIDDIEKCRDKARIEKYGPYWSPWLEGEYRDMQQKGESHLFRQEILAEFIGSGSTVLSPTAIARVMKMVDESFLPEIPADIVEYIHPQTGNKEHLEFRGNTADEGLRIWRKPVKPDKSVLKNGKLVSDNPGHTYVMGVDIATGKNQDFSAIQIFDVDTMEQVAEYLGKVRPDTFSKIVDYLGRWYNNALACIERTGIGDSFIDDMQDLLYPSLWRKKRHNTNQLGPIGFATSQSGKATLNKMLKICISENEGDGYYIRSERLLDQLVIYVKERNRLGFETGKTGAQKGRGNHDDLVMAAALAFVAINDAVAEDAAGLIPIKNKDQDMVLEAKQRANLAQHQAQLVHTNDPNILMPYTMMTMNNNQMTPEQELAKFTNQLGGRPIDTRQVISHRKHNINYNR